MTPDDQILPAPEDTQPLAKVRENTLAQGEGRSYAAIVDGRFRRVELLGEDGRFLSVSAYGGDTRSVTRSAFVDLADAPFVKRCIDDPNLVRSEYKDPSMLVVDCLRWMSPTEPVSEDLLKLRLTALGVLSPDEVGDLLSNLLKKKSNALLAVKKADKSFALAKPKSAVGRPPSSSTPGDDTGEQSVEPAGTHPLSRQTVAWFEFAAAVEQQNWDASPPDIASLKHIDVRSIPKLFELLLSKRVDLAFCLFVLNPGVQEKLGTRIIRNNPPAMCIDALIRSIPNAEQARVTTIINLMIDQAALNPADLLSLASTIHSSPVNRSVFLPRIKTLGAEQRANFLRALIISDRSSLNDPEYWEGLDVEASICLLRPTPALEAILDSSLFAETLLPIVASAAKSASSSLQNTVFLMPLAVQARLPPDVIDNIARRASPNSVIGRIVHQVTEREKSAAYQTHAELQGELAATVARLTGTAAENDELIDHLRNELSAATRRLELLSERLTSSHEPGTAELRQIRIDGLRVAAELAQRVLSRTDRIVADLADDVSSLLSRTGLKLLGEVGENRKFDPTTDHEPTGMSSDTTTVRVVEPGVALLESGEPLVLVRVLVGIV